MHRIDTPTAQEGKFGAGKNGFTAGDPTLGVPATQLDETFFDSVQEEICAVIEGAGIQLKKSDRAQLSTAINKMIQAKHELALLIKNNLSDVDDVEQARKNLGLGKLALKDSLTAGDVGALSLAGGTVSGATTFNSEITLNSNMGIYGPQPYIDFHFGSSSDYTTRLIENTSGNLHVLGSFSASKTITPGDYSNFDARYQAKGDYTPAGQAYTKAESDERYPLKTATVIGARVGARGTLGSGNGDTDIEAPVGNFITGRVGSNGDVRYTKWYIRAFQINVNGTWKTITA